MMHLIERSNGLEADIDAWNSTQSVKKTTRTKRNREKKERKETHKSVNRSMPLFFLSRNQRTGVMHEILPKKEGSGLNRLLHQAKKKRRDT